MSAIPADRASAAINKKGTPVVITLSCAFAVCKTTKNVTNFNNFNTFRKKRKIIIDDDDDDDDRNDDSGNSNDEDYDNEDIQDHNESHVKRPKLE